MLSGRIIDPGIRPGNVLQERVQPGAREGGRFDHVIGPDGKRGKLFLVGFSPEYLSIFVPHPFFLRRLHFATANIRPERRRASRPEPIQRELPSKEPENRDLTGLLVPSSCRDYG
jgi:hypothetical protein